MFLDASVLVAALADEPEAATIKAAMLDSSSLTSSPIAMFETSCRLAKLRRMTIAEARDLVAEFLDNADVTLIPVDGAVSAEAHACADRYHHLMGHPARLNMGDCFAYAAARVAGARLAYKGNDFVHTDVDGVRFGS